MDKIHCQHSGLTKYTSLLQFRQSELSQRARSSRRPTGADVHHSCCTQTELGFEVAKYRHHSIARLGNEENRTQILASRL